MQLLGCQFAFCALQEEFTDPYVLSDVILLFPKWTDRANQIVDVYKFTQAEHTHTHTRRKKDRKLSQIFSSQKQTDLINFDFTKSVFLWQTKGASLGKTLREEEAFIIDSGWTDSGVREGQSLRTDDTQVNIVNRAACRH